MIDAAARGGDDDRAAFARRYSGVVGAYFGARWRVSPLASDAEDACQEVFVECFKNGGALERVEPGRPGGFRGFLFGRIIRGRNFGGALNSWSR